MADVPIAAMKAVAERLNGLGLDYAFLGGSVVGLLLDHPELSPVRATDDVDVVIEVVGEQTMLSTRKRADPPKASARCALAPTFEPSRRGEGSGEPTASH